MTKFDKHWILDDGPNGLKNSEFDLERHTFGPIVFYTVNNKTGEHAEDWSRVRLISLGRLHRQWAPLPPLAPAIPDDPVSEEAYQTAIKVWLKGVTSTTLRLEGELEVLTELELTEPDEPVIQVGMAPVKVTMLIAQGAVSAASGQPRDLLIVHCGSQLFAAAMGPGGGDGTGHGDRP